MICSSNFKVCSVHCHGHLASCGEKLTSPHWRAFQPVFNQHHYTPALPTLVSLFTSAKAFRVPTDTQNSVMVSYFDRDSLRSITSKMGWEGRGKKTTDKTLHQSVATEQILSCDPVVCCLTHACNVHFIYMVHTHVFCCCCTFCYEYSKVKWFLIAVTESCSFCNWVTREIVCCLCCFFGVVNDQCRTNKICTHKPNALYPTPLLG